MTLDHAACLSAPRSDVRTDGLRSHKPFDEGQRRLDLIATRWVERVPADRVEALGLIVDLVGELATTPALPVPDLATTFSDERRERREGFLDLLVRATGVEQQQCFVRI